MSMAKDVTTAIFHIVLRRFRVELGFDAQTGDSNEKWTGYGYIDITESQFKGKGCCVTFGSLTTARPAAFAEIANLHGLADTCGVVTVRAGITTQDGLDPIDVYVPLDASSYQRTLKIILTCISSHCDLRISFSITHQKFTGLWMPLDQLDSSETYEYPIVRFDLSAANLRDAEH